VTFSSLVGVGGATWSGTDPVKLAKEGYQKNIIAFRCVSLIARGVASLPWIAYAGDKELEENHPLLQLLNVRPNPLQGGGTFFEALTSFYLIAGNTYIKAVGPDIGPPTELWTLMPQRMKVVTGGKGRVTGYVYTVRNAKDLFTFDMDHVERSPILHIKSFNPLEDHYGMSRLEAAAFSIDQHNAAGEWNYKLLKNDARPSGTLTFKPADPLMPDTLTEEQFDQLKTDFKERNTGPANAGNPMFLDGGLSWQQMSLSPVDMDFLNAKNTSARDIASAYNIPPMLIGIVGDATFANYHEARLAAWEEEIIPDAGIIRDELNRWLAPKFGDNIRLDFNVDSIPALAEKNTENWAKIDAASFLEINEKRAAAGYDDIDGGDVILVPALMIPLGDEGSDEETEDLPPDKAAELGYGL